MNKPLAIALALLLLLALGFGVFLLNEEPDGPSLGGDSSVTKTPSSRVGEEDERSLVAPPEVEAKTTPEVATPEKAVTEAPAKPEMVTITVEINVDGEPGTKGSVVIGRGIEVNGQMRDDLPNSLRHSDVKMGSLEVPKGSMVRTFARVEGLTQDYHRARPRLGYFRADKDYTYTAYFFRGKKVSVVFKDGAGSAIKVQPAPLTPYVDLGAKAGASMNFLLSPQKSFTFRVREDTGSMGRDRFYREFTLSAGQIAKAGDAAIEFPWPPGPVLNLKFVDAETQNPMAAKFKLLMPLMRTPRNMPSEIGGRDAEATFNINLEGALYSMAEEALGRKRGDMPLFSEVIEMLRPIGRNLLPMKFEIEAEGGLPTSAAFEVDLGEIHNKQSVVIERAPNRLELLITDSETGEPLEGVNVVAKAEVYADRHYHDKAQSDKHGKTALRLASIQYSIRVSHEGYLSQNFRETFNAAQQSKAIVLQKAQPVKLHLQTPDGKELEGLGRYPNKFLSLYRGQRNRNTKLSSPRFFQASMEANTLSIYGLPKGLYQLEFLPVGALPIFVNFAVIDQTMVVELSAEVVYHQEVEMTLSQELQEHMKLIEGLELPKPTRLVASFRNGSQGLITASGNHAHELANKRRSTSKLTLGSAEMKKDKEGKTTIEARFQEVEKAFLASALNERIPVRIRNGVVSVDHAACGSVTLSVPKAALAKIEDAPVVRLSSGEFAEVITRSGYSRNAYLRNFAQVKDGKVHFPYVPAGEYFFELWDCEWKGIGLFSGGPKKYSLLLKVPAGKNTQAALAPSR